MNGEKFIIPQSAYRCRFTRYQVIGGVEIKNLGQWIEVLDDISDYENNKSNTVFIDEVKRFMYITLFTNSNSIFDSDTKKCITQYSRKWTRINSRLTRSAMSKVINLRVDDAVPYLRNCGVRNLNHLINKLEGIVGNSNNKYNEFNHSTFNQIISSVTSTIEFDKDVNQYFNALVSKWKVTFNEQKEGINSFLRNDIEVDDIMEIGESDDEIMEEMKPYLFEFKLNKT